MSYWEAVELCNDLLVILLVIGAFYGVFVAGYFYRVTDEELDAIDAWDREETERQDRTIKWFAFTKQINRARREVLRG